MPKPIILKEIENKVDKRDGYDLIAVADAEKVSKLVVNDDGSVKVGSVASADKLTTPRNINLGGAVGYTTLSFDGSKNVSADIAYLNEAYIQWGGKNLEDSISPIDVACSNLHSANRFAFSKPDGVVIEYSNDGGNTWLDIGATNENKIRLISGIGVDSFRIGNKFWQDNASLDDMLRITLDAMDMGVCTRLRKLLINISTNGAKGAYVTIEKSLIENPLAFTTIDTYNIGGWSGWNSIPLWCAFGGYATSISNVRKLRLTFGITELDDRYTNLLHIADIVGIGDTYWMTPSDMAKTGHLYSYDYEKNAIFPATVKAANFVDSTNGKNISEIYATKSEIPSVPQASSKTPSALGTASVGTETTFARGDHVHPLQTSVENATKATNDADGNPIKTTYRLVSESYTKTEVDTAIKTAVQTYITSALTTEV